MAASGPPYLLVDPDLLVALMRRTGTGSPIAVRTLADRVGLAHSSLQDLRTGRRKHVDAETAQAIADTIGVDLLILFAPTGRAVPAPVGEIRPQAVPA